VGFGLSVASTVMVPNSPWLMKAFGSLAGPSGIKNIALKLQKE
jgi:hypothetical protein